MNAASSCKTPTRMRIQIVVALPAAFPLSKLRFWGRETVFNMVILGLLIPVHAIALPLYIMLAKVELINTYAALIVPWTISVFGIFLMRQFFMTVPDDLIDAARMDGMFTPPLGLREFKGDADGSFYGPMMATATVIVTPLIVAFLLAQKHFIEGITLTGMK